MDSSVIDLGDFCAISTDGALSITANISLFIRLPSEYCEISSAHELRELVVEEKLHVSSTTAFSITFCLAIREADSSTENLEKDSFALLRLLSCIIEESNVWRKLNLRVHSSTEPCHHRCSSSGLSFTLGNANNEPPFLYNGRIPVAKAESVHCTLKVGRHTRLPLGRVKRKAEGSESTRLRKKRKANHGSGASDERLPSGFGEYSPSGKPPPTTDLPSDGAAGCHHHPELEALLSLLVEQLLLGSCSRRTKRLRKSNEFPLVDLAPAIFNQRMVQAVETRMRWVHISTQTMEYFAAAARTPSLRRKLQALIENNHDTGSTENSAAQGGPAYKRLRALTRDHIRRVNRTSKSKTKVAEEAPGASSQDIQGDQISPHGLREDGLDVELLASYPPSLYSGDMDTLSSEVMAVENPRHKMTDRARVLWRPAHDVAAPEEAVTGHLPAGCEFSEDQNPECASDTWHLGSFRQQDLHDGPEVGRSDEWPQVDVGGLYNRNSESNTQSTWGSVDEEILVTNGGFGSSSDGHWYPANCSAWDGFESFAP